MCGRTRLSSDVSEIELRFSIPPTAAGAEFPHSQHSELPLGARQPDSADAQIAARE
jgi:hypothetical protein